MNSLSVGIVTVILIPFICKCYCIAFSMIVRKCLRIQTTGSGNLWFEKMVPDVTLNVRVEVGTLLQLAITAKDRLAEHSQQGLETA